MRFSWSILVAVPAFAAPAPSVPATPAPQAALSRELAPKLNRFQEVWDRCPEARLRGPATVAFRRFVAESIDRAGDKNARRQWLRTLPSIDARQLGPDAGGSFVAVVPKACTLPTTPWAVSVQVAGTADPEDLLAVAPEDAAESSATAVGKPVPEPLYAPMDGAAILALGREGVVKKPFLVFATPEAAAAAAKKSGGVVAKLTVAPGAAAGPGRELVAEKDHWKWLSPTALGSIAASADVPLHWLPVGDLVAAAATVPDVAAWKALATVFAAASPLPSESRRFVANAAENVSLPEPLRRALATLGNDGGLVTDLPPVDGVEAIIGLDETLDRRAVQRLLPSWIVQLPPVAGWMERIAKAHPDAILDGWSPSILDDDARLAAAWIGMGLSRKALVERAAQRETSESTLRRLGEVARLDREPTVRATTAILDHAMCLRHSASSQGARCGLYGVMLSLLGDGDARVRYAAEAQLRYRADVRGHRFASAPEWSALLEPLPKGPGEIGKILPIVKAAGDDESFARWARTSEGRHWIAAVTASDASGADDLRRWALESLGPLPPTPTQAAAGVSRTKTGAATPPEFAALAAKVNASVPVEPARQPAAVEPTISTIDNVRDLSDSPDAAEAQKGGDETPDMPLMPAPGK